MLRLRIAADDLHLAAYARSRAVASITLKVSSVNLTKHRIEAAQLLRRMRASVACAVGATTTRAGKCKMSVGAARRNFSDAWWKETLREVRITVADDETFRYEVA